MTEGDDPAWRAGRGQLGVEDADHAVGVRTAYADPVDPPGGQVGEDRDLAVQLVAYGRGLLGRRPGGAARQRQADVAATQLDHPR